MNRRIDKNRIDKNKPCGHLKKSRPAGPVGGPHIPIEPDGG